MFEFDQNLAQQLSEVCLRSSVDGRVGRSWGPENQEKSILRGVLGGLGGILGLKS